LIANRFLQALGGCVGMVGARAVVRDVFPRSETARIFSLLVLILGIAPIVAPMIGGLIVAAAGWRWIFGLLAILAAALIAAVAIWIPATSEPDTSVALRPDRVVRQYMAVLREPTFLVYAVASGGVSGGLFAYIAGLPFVGMTLMDFSEQQFAWIFGINAAGFVAGSQVNGYLVRRCASSSIAFAASCVQFAAAAGLIIGTAMGVLHTPATLALVFAFMVCLGFLNPNTMALALNPFTRNVGSASALLGAIQMLAGAMASGLVSLLHNNTAIPMAGVMAISSSTSFLMLLASRQRRAAVAADAAE
jgi:DHA1 family bicyclomycin/chloramphenicol resistance-like MFS transporter